MSDNKTHKHSSIEVRSEEIEDILGKPPQKIIRWGISVVLVVFLILMTGSYFMKYPDILGGDIEVTSDNPPAYIASRVNGKIEKIFVDDKQMVDSGDYLMIIDNPANYIDVFQVKEKLLNAASFFNGYDVKKLDSRAFRKAYSLGIIQPFYSDFITSLEKYIHLLNLDFHQKKIKSLESEFSMFNLYYDRLYRQKIIIEEDLELSKKDYDRYSTLFNNGVTSEIELEDARSEYLQKELAFQQARTDLANTKIQISKLEQSILDLQLQEEQEINELQLQINETYKDLLSQVRIWEKDFVLKAPFSGIATFNTYWIENQNVEEGEEVMAIVPVKESRIIGKIKLKTRGAGKVLIGQDVNVKLNNYPYMEFGMVKGKVDDISLVPSDDDDYLVEVIFPNGLKTNYGINLNFNQKMLGHAEIITEEIPLIVRIIRPVKSLIKNRSMRRFPEPKEE